MPHFSALLRRIWPLVIVAVVTCLIEAVLQLADAGLVGTPVWRSQAYQYGGFWSGLLRDWQPNYPAQPWTMFLSYSVLHAGAAHLFGNMAALVWLGQALADRMPGWCMTGLYAASALGGAAVFGLLSPSNAPMVGASGALFGLAGAWVASEYLIQSRARPGASGAATSRRAALRTAGGWCLVLIVLNGVTWAFEDGALAWQTHLGGFVTGAALVLIFQSRRGTDPKHLA